MLDEFVCVFNNVYGEAEHRTRDCSDVSAEWTTNIFPLLQRYNVDRMSHQSERVATDCGTSCVWAIVFSPFESSGLFSMVSRCHATNQWMAWMCLTQYMSLRILERVSWSHSLVLAVLSKKIPNSHSISQFSYMWRVLTSSVSFLVQKRRSASHTHMYCSITECVQVRSNQSIDLSCNHTHPLVVACFFIFISLCTNAEVLVWWFGSLLSSSSLPPSVHCLCETSIHTQTDRHTWSTHTQEQDSQKFSCAYMYLHVWMGERESMVMLMMTHAYRQTDTTHTELLQRLEAFSNNGRSATRVALVLFIIVITVITIATTTYLLLLLLLLLTHAQHRMVLSL